MWPEIHFDMQPACPVPTVPDKPQTRLAKHFNVDPNSIWCGPMEHIVRALPEGRVAVAQPCAPEITDSIVKSGRRYVDAGRNHLFAIHPSGWRFALALPKIETAWLMIPNEPLNRMPKKERIEEAQSSDALLVLDGRYDLRPFRKDLGELTGNMMWIRSTDLASGHDTGTVVAIVSPECTAKLGPSDEIAAGQHARWIDSKSMDDRVTKWVQRLGVDMATSDFGRGALSAGVWEVVPGVASCDITSKNVSPSFEYGWRITSSPHWTWRDGVRLSPDAQRGGAIVEQIPD